MPNKSTFLTAAKLPAETSVTSSSLKFYRLPQETVKGWFKTPNKVILLQKADEATSDCNCVQVILFCFLPSSTQYTAVKQNEKSKKLFVLFDLSLFSLSMYSMLSL